jgi:hypothetical protein
MPTHTARPPILRFLLLFCGLLAIATSLAALSSTADTPAAEASQSASTTAR